ncbi:MULTISPECIES: RNA polymerase sigma factor region1.1 domain-containing protein [unclassified Bradyrhizobium]|uniref:RNA polymerase sigma factor region1.1 domain-containing protein n=1 Tax=unclassified Bradyrhizobium TaxID=2631580 RepID=UPI0020B33ACD|nr:MULTISPECIES: RNA polymerase sigma factor region1.1 domain-containing protein [unclassified Bradyrhizobium]MCP3386732.1 RNA polymerase subunit sigma-70 [Bradyrhizobium sp. CCGUVB4N]MCP3447951.1 RNA polymerase subunit sigma-70 [Bradyrhizobium sp. CCGUVB14]WFU81934.1 RNA polymerase sigma factor region1.1 domain-containing protein [Bradyrhizobium sp. CIAT3101]
MDWSEVVRKAVILAEKTGYVTFDQLNELLPSAKVEPKDIEAILTALSERGIWIAEE